MGWGTRQSSEDGIGSGSRGSGGSASCAPADTAAAIRSARGGRYHHR